MSIFDHPDTVSAAPSWRCPGCGTLQPETTRCWRCAKAAYTCDTCHCYRPSLAVGLGYCAKDPARVPLHADESRSCWEAATARGPGTAPSTLATGLFPESIETPAPAVPDDARRPLPVAPPPRVKPPLEPPGRAAWAEPREGGLVEAPVVEPGKRLTTELQRRRSSR